MISIKFTRLYNLWPSFFPTPPPKKRAQIGFYYLQSSGFFPLIISSLWFKKNKHLCFFKKLRQNCWVWKCFTILVNHLHFVYPDWVSKLFQPHWFHCLLLKGAHCLEINEILKWSSSIISSSVLHWRTCLPLPTFPNSESFCVVSGISLKPLLIRASPSWHCLTDWWYPCLSVLGLYASPSIFCAWLWNM